MKGIISKDIIPGKLPKKRVESTKSVDVSRIKDVMIIGGTHLKAAAILCLTIIAHLLKILSFQVRKVRYQLMQSTLM